MFWLLALDVFYQFFTRYVLADSASWTEEIARYLLIVVTFLGRLDGGASQHSYPCRVHVPLSASDRVGRMLSTFVDLVRVAFLATPPICCQLVPKMHNLKMTVIDFPMSFIYGFVALGFALMTWRSSKLRSALAARLESA